MPAMLSDEEFHAVARAPGSLRIAFSFPRNSCVPEVDGFGCGGYQDVRCTDMPPDMVQEAPRRGTPPRMQEVSLACTGGEDDGKIFMYLCEIGDTAGVERALARFPLLIHTQDLETGATPLMCAGKSGSAQLLRLLATSGASLTARDKRGLDALARACRFGNVDAVFFLIGSGVDPNHVDMYGLAPLHQAVLGNHPLTVRTLLGAGVDKEVRDSKGNTPLALARLLLAKGSHDSPVLVHILSEGHDEAADGEHADADAAAAAAGAEGGVGGAGAMASPAPPAPVLHAEAAQAAIFLQKVKAGELGKVEVFLTLDPALARACDARTGLTAAMVAAFGGHLEVLRALVRSGADLAAQEPKQGWDALMLASRSGHAECVAFLLSAGLSEGSVTVRRQDRAGNTALHHAVLGDRHPVISLLLASGADQRCSNSAGRTPLGLAVDSAASVNVLQLLGGSVEDIMMRLPDVRVKLLCCGNFIGYKMRPGALVRRSRTAEARRDGAAMDAAMAAGVGGDPGRISPPRASAASASASTPSASPHATSPILAARSSRFATVLPGASPSSSSSLSSKAAAALASAAAPVGSAAAAAEAAAAADAAATAAIPAAAAAAAAAAATVSTDDDPLDTDPAANPGPTSTSAAAPAGIKARLAARLAAEAAEAEAAAAAAVAAAAAASAAAASAAAAAAADAADAAPAPAPAPAAAAPAPLAPPPDALLKSFAVAVSSGNVNGVLSALALHPALVNMEEGGFLPMLRGAKEGNLEVVQALLRSGGSLGSVDKRGMTPVAVAARFARKEVLAYLLAQPGVDVNVRDIHKCTPLHHAVLGNAVECVRLLLGARGLSVDAQDALGNTPEKLARAQLKKGKGSEEVVALFNVQV